MYGMFDVVPVAERTFEAKITDVFHHGFTIEATIDNKPLRGLLFSYKPGFAHAAHDYITRFGFLARALWGWLPFDYLSVVSVICQNA